MANNLIGNDYIVINSNDLINIIKKTIEVVNKGTSGQESGFFKNLATSQGHSDVLDSQSLDVEKKSSLLQGDKAVTSVTQAKQELGIMNVNELAEYISYAKPTIYQYVHKKTIPYYKKGKKLFFKKAEIDEWLQKDS